MFLHVLILNHYKQKSYSMYVFVLYAKFTVTEKSIIYFYIQANKCLNLVCFQGRHKTSVLSILFYSIVIVSSYLYVPYITLKAKSDLSYNRPKITSTSYSYVLLERILMPVFRIFLSYYVKLHE